MEKRARLYLSQIKSLIFSSKLSILGFVGVTFVLLSLYFGNRMISGSSKVEVLQTPDTGHTTTSKVDSGNIVIDVGGAVQKPGVYHLSSSSRVDDAITASGGLSPDADLNWVNKNLNRAAKLIDGQKIFIPIQQTTVLGANDSNGGTNVAQSGNTSDSNLVNINGASLTDLENLDGIGPKYAQNIVDHRPYSDVSELTSKKVIPLSAYNKIVTKISVY